MLITVKDVLELDGFKHAKIVAGKKGLSNVVNNATLMEVPDIFSYVDAHSLLITTLYPIYNNETATNELIPKLVELNLAGICIKPARYIKEIQPIMIEQANELDFPIIELPQDANLSKLVTEILELSLNKHINILNFRNHVHESLMKLFLKGEDIDSLVNSLSEIVKYPVLLLDNDFNITYMSKDLTEQEVTIMLPSNRYRNNNFIVKVQDVEYGEESYIKYSINAGKTRFGYIVLLKGEVDNNSLIVAVEQASLLIASVFYKNYAVLEKEKSFQDAFIRDILQGKIDSPIDTINKAKVFGWNMEFPEVIMIIKLLVEDDQKKKQLYGELLDSRLIQKILEEKLLINDKKLKTVYIDDSIVVFINVVFMTNIKENCKEVGRLIVERLKDKVKLGIGISNIAKDISSFSLAYKEAQSSIIISAILNKSSFVSHYSDYEMFKIIKEVKDIDILNTYVDSKLGKLIEYDKVNNMKLMETLKVLIEQNFNAKKSAEILFIHYNTLRYRVDRIKELGIKIDDGFVVGELVLAYNIYLWLLANKD
ncbi:PucR family transcriptional regulator ligand-binding domain-containing protein [Tissierella sp. MB52-C2]|uniref:PucR family transcriptional regulator n=1 Tax=Tissierella sp. MB52-C2 TaxID=3070999 RepID=UPI00280AFFD8|nr:PucR family transcriptional regulator ligand-binding domain-containing protein [Tissierella sp. MB52-C2]WMM24513.1 PucR family transcriptional regulator ligand-binding domain-containing protein [Tissierella sp. MB52-C2]